MPGVIVFQLLILHILLTLPHELGHFIAARLVGVSVPEVGIGLPPTLVAIRWRGTRVRLNLLPLGAFIGYDSAEARPATRRIAIAVAGPAANLLVALICLALIQAPTPVNPTGLDVRAAPDLTYGVATPGGSNSFVSLVGLTTTELGKYRSQWTGLPDFLRMLLAASVTVGFVNLLPFPPLDGGKLLFVVLRLLGCGPEIERRAGRAGFIGLSFLATAGFFLTLASRT